MFILGRVMCSGTGLYIMSMILLLIAELYTIKSSHIVIILTIVTFISMVCHHIFGSECDSGNVMVDDTIDICSFASGFAMAFIIIGCISSNQYIDTIYVSWIVFSALSTFIMAANKSSRGK